MANDAVDRLCDVLAGHLAPDVVVEYDTDNDSLFVDSRQVWTEVRSQLKTLSLEQAAGLVLDALNEIDPGRYPVTEGLRMDRSEVTDSPDPVTEEDT